MEITKGITLSQFVDNEDVVLRDTSVNNCIAERIIYYNRLLMQSLTKHMFVNELEVPLDIYYTPEYGCQKYPQECFLDDVERYDKANLSVIFKNFTYYETQAEYIRRNHDIDDN